jgi:membrane-associated HD superfamily phosphohydrolase
MAFSDELWQQAQVLYESGVLPKLIATRLGMNVSQISRRMNTENWARQASKKNLKNVSPTITETLDKIEKAFEHTAEDGLLARRLKKIESEVVYTKACKIQLDILDLIEEAKEAVSNLIKDNINGTYIKKEGKDGITFGLISEVFSPMASILNATALFTQKKGDITVTNNTQINQSNPELSPVQIEFTPVEFIK